MLRIYFPLIAFIPFIAAAEPRVLDDSVHHLRIDGPREWSSFPERAGASKLEIDFQSAESNAGAWTLSLFQHDVKQTWNVTLNGKPLGRLVRDENEMTIYLPIPEGGIVEGKNRIVMEQQVRRGSQPDDIRAGRITIHKRPMSDLLGEAQISLEVVDEQSNERLPARITIVNRDGALQATGASSSKNLAVRPGVIYTASGEATFGVPPGRYTIYAGRGFEYSLDQVDVEVAEGDRVSRKLEIAREVPTAGYVACDTHVHSLTHSGHGDATVQERMITLAAEGIELPVATDHNVQIDHEPFAREMKVRQYFTPVIGNEVTTKIGHFNIFPVRNGAPPPNHKLTSWAEILDDIFRTPDVKIAILNHGRDLHSGVRPLGPKLFNDAAGENTESWAVRFNAMEVVNSAAVQSDPLRLFHDWMALLNRGRTVTPVGSSDSHDVARHFVGQGRTYIRCRDDDPGAIDVDEAVNGFIQGRVLVSYGLICEIVVEGKYRSGELARVSGEEIEVTLRVLGPHWVNAESITLYANGQPLESWEVDDRQSDDLPRGVKWAETIRIPRPPHDVFLTAMATGPGVEGLFWRTAKPYQPSSPDWDNRVIGCSGAVWLDCDGDGRPTSARDYAEKLFAAFDQDLGALVKHLNSYDTAVAIQAAHLIQESGKSLLADDAQRTWRAAEGPVRTGFETYLNAWRTNQQASRE